MCVLSDHQLANHQEFELSVIGENSKEHCAQDIISEFEDARTQRISSESDTVMFEGRNEYCAQAIIPEFEDARTHKVTSESNTVVITAEIHAENTDAQHIVHFEEAQDAGTYASWVQQALYESYDEVRAQQQRATHRQKRNYDSKAVARAFPIGCWTLRYYPPARKNKLCSPWIGPYKIVRAPMEWVVGIQIDADARIVYVHMDDLKRCAPPNPEPTWPETARGTSIVVSTCAPSTLALSDVTRSRNTPDNTSHRPRSSAHHPQSVTSGQTDVRAPTLPVLRDSAHHTKSSISGQIDVRAPSNEENIVKTDTVQDSIVKTYAVPSSTWNLQDENCILSMKSNCSIDVKGYRFFTVERLFYALQLLSLGDRKFIGQLAKYSRMDYVRKCVNKRFELASRSLQDKWLDEQFQTWTQIITARILSDPVFKQALLDSAGSPLFDPEEPVYATALTSARKMCVQRKLLCWPTWITLPTRVTRGQVLV